MAAEFDVYIRRNSWIHALDPRVKLLFVVEFSVLLFVWPLISSALAVILLCALGFWQARVPLAYVTRVWRMMAPIVLLVFALTALFGGRSGIAWFTIGPETIYSGSVYMGALLGLRLLALAWTVFLWLFTTDQTAMVKGFVALRLPYEWGLTLALALRYLPTIGGLFDQVREAQQARGLDLEGKRFMARLRAYRPVLVSMIINAVRQSERLGWALEARALGARGTRRSVFRPIRFRPPDYVALAALLVILVASVATRALL